MEPTEPPRKHVLTLLILIRWGDMDAYGHVNKTLYFRYMEQIRIEYQDSIGYTVPSETASPVIINAACTFLIPLTYPGMVEIRMFFGAPGRSSIPSSYEIRLQGNESLYATGDEKIVWMEAASGKSVAIPEDFRALLSAISA